MSGYFRGLSRKYMGYGKTFCRLFLLLAVVGSAHSLGSAQALSLQIEGTILDKEQEPVISASIILSQTDGTALQYAISDVRGRFSLSYRGQPNDTLMLTVRSLGFVQVCDSLFFLTGEVYLTKDYLLSRSIQGLQEVVIEGRPPITERNDTIIFNAEDFRDDSEDVVEDILRKLPGVNVSENGQIAYQGKEISRILLDGDDLTDTNYKMLSRNLPAELVSEVEILTGYTDKRLMKGIENSEEIAINLSIYEDKKAPLFGDVRLGLGVPGFYEGSADLLSYLSRLKSVTFLDINNTGGDPVGADFERYTFSQLAYSGVDHLESVHAGGIIYPLNMSSGLFRVNDAKYASSSWILNATEKIKIRGIHSFYMDRLDFQASSETYFSNDTEVDLLQASNTTEQSRPQQLFTGVNMTYQIGRQVDLYANLSFLRDAADYRNDFFLNGETGFERLDNNAFTGSGNINLVMRPADHLVTDTEVTFIRASTNDQSTTGLAALDTLFGTDMLTQNAQQASNVLLLTNATKWIAGTFLFNLNSGVVLQEQEFTNLFREESGNILDESLIGDLGGTGLTLERQSAYVEAFFEKSVGKYLELLAGSRLRSEWNRFAGQIDHNLLIEPIAKIVYERNASRLSLLLNRENAYFSISELQRASILNGFNSLRTNQYTAADFTTTNSLAFSYVYRDNTARFLSVYLRSYVYATDPFALQQTSLSPQGIFIHEGILSKDLQNTGLSVQLGVDKYLSKLSSTLKLGYAYRANSSWSSFNQELLESRLGTHSINWSMGVLTGDRFSFGLGAKFVFGTLSLSDSQRSRLNNHELSTNVTWKPADKIRCNLRVNYYSFNTDVRTTEATLWHGTYTFHYDVRPDKIALELRVNNVFNQKSMNMWQNNILFTQASQYELLPRFFLVGIDFKI